MTYAGGSWGIKARLRSQRRTKYFRNYRRLHPQYESHGSSMGYQGEMIGLKLLVGSKRINRPCDLNWNGKLVDVKTAKPTLVTSGQYRWKFLLSKQKEIADLYLLIRKDNDNRIIDIYLIPNTGKKNISFNSKTVIKYSKYLLSL